jgi:succinoglycan biosynthesis transport protein ExoP
MNADAKMLPGGSGAIVPQDDLGGDVFIRRHAPVPPDGALPHVDPRRFLHMLWSWRWLFVTAFLLSGALAAMLTFIMTPKYMARATVEINQPEAQMVSEDKQDPVVVRDPQFLTTQLGLLKSEALTDRVAVELGLPAKADFVPQAASRPDRIVAASQRVRSNLDVKPVDTSRLIEVSYSDTDPARASRVVNSLVDNFISMNLERRYDATANARRFLETRIASVKTALEKSERQLVGYARQQGIILVGQERENSGGSGTGSTSLQAESLVNLNQALAASQNARIEAEQRYRQARSMGTSAQMVANPAIQALNAQLAGLEAEYSQKQSRYKPGFPEMVELRGRIEGLRKQIAAQSGNVARSEQGEFLAAVGRERALGAKVDQLKASVQDLRDRSVQYNILQREVDTNRTLYDGLLQRYKEIGVAGGIGSNTASVVDRAKAPRGPYSPNLILNVILGLMLGGAGALLIAFLFEYLDDTIKSPDDVKTKLNQNILGAVPILAKNEVFYEALQLPDSKMTEAYSTVRANIQFSTTSGAPKTMLVTSSQAEEGKSSTSYAVALNFARLGRSVLIIDADMRKPSFRPSHGESDGLSSLLTDNSSLAQSVLATEVEGLYLLPSGPVPPNPAELLSSERMKRLLDEVTSNFDHVIVDAPPLLGLADAALLGALCDATIFVVQANRTRRPGALSALERLKAGRAKIIGTILTRYKATAGYGYAYAYYAYGGVSSTTSSAIPLLTLKLS